MKALGHFGRGSALRAALRLLGSLVAVVALSGCWGFPSPPQNVNPTKADLHALVECDANNSSNPCQGYFTYWADGQQAHATTIPQPPIVDTTAVNNLDIFETATGLTPGTLYHYEWCGQGDQNVTQPLCMGTDNNNNAPNNLPTAIDATENFVTPNPNANPPTVGTIDRGRLTSSGEANGFVYSRDAGQSVQYSTNPPKSLWTFGDTGVFQNNNLVGFLNGSTAATATFTSGSPSASLTEIATGNPCSHGACQFLGSPPPLQNCGTGSRQFRYPGGMANEPGTSRIVVFYADTCIPPGSSTCCVQNMGVTEYDPVSNTFTQPFTTVFHDASSSLPDTEIFGSAAYYNSDGYLYVFGSTSGFLFGANLIVARVPANPASWTNPSAYQWYGNGTWGDVAHATPVSTYGSKLGMNVAYYPAKGVYALVAGFAPTFEVSESSTPWGPWTLAINGSVPDTCPSCRAMVGHPELSTATQLTYTWWSGDDFNPHGHIRIGTMPW